MEKSSQDSSQDGRTTLRRGAMNLRGGVKTRGGRLPPIRTREMPAAQPSVKRGVAPKIPVRRIKKEPVETDAVVKKEPGSTRGRPRGGRGKGMGRKEYIQLEGSIFCDGPAARKKDIRQHAERERIPREAGVGHKRVKTKKEAEDETERIKDLLNTYGVDEDLIEDENKILPVRIPFPKNQIKKEIKKEETDADTKPLIKQEVIEDEEMDKKKKDPLEGIFYTRIKSEDFKEEIKDNELMNHLNKSKETDMLILIQFPKCVPFNKTHTEFEETNSTNPGSNKRENSTKTKSAEHDEEEEEKTECSVSDMQEGFVGKLQILKSGRMRLILGFTSLSFEPGSRPAFYQELLSAKCQEDSGDLTCLGVVRHRFICHPLIETLITEVNRENYVLENVFKSTL